MPEYFQKSVLCRIKILLANKVHSEAIPGYFDNINKTIFFSWVNATL